MVPLQCFKPKMLAIPVHRIKGYHGEQQKEFFWPDMRSCKYEGGPSWHISPRRQDANSPTRWAQLAGSIRPKLSKKCQRMFSSTVSSPLAPVTRRNMYMTCQTAFGRKWKKCIDEQTRIISFILQENKENNGLTGVLLSRRTEHSFMSSMKGVAATRYGRHRRVYNILIQFAPDNVEIGDWMEDETRRNEALRRKAEHMRRSLPEDLFFSPDSNWCDNIPDEQKENHYSA